METLPRFRYGLTDHPPWYVTLGLGFQHYLLMFAGTLALPVLLAPALCMEKEYVAISEICGTLFFVSGLITMMQSTLGVRLPLVQSGSVVFLVPAYAIMSLPKWRCPSLTNATIDSDFNITWSVNHSSLDNFTGHERDSTEDSTEVWQSRMRELQGAFIVSSLVEVLIGVSGLAGVMLRFIGPVCICPTIMLSGVALYKTANRICSKHWGISSMTIVLVVVLSQHMEKLAVPVPIVSRKNGRRTRRVQIFGYFPVIIAMLVAWLICLVLTLTNVLSSDPDSAGHTARTDTKLAALTNAKWFRIPYPFQWGMPTVSGVAVLAMISGVLAGIVDAVGDYFVAAQLSGAPPPTVSAVNRGIFIEGIGILLAGVFGTGNATITFGQNIGALAMTKVGSRRVIQCCALIMMLFGVLSKVGAVFVTIPEPVIGGVLMVIFGFVVASGMINLQNIDLQSNRNLFIIGFSLLLGISLPDWVAGDANQIQTGSEITDQLIIVLLSNHMFVGGFTSCLLDNTISGTHASRGLTSFRAQADTCSQQHKISVSECYDLPFGMDFIRRWKCAEYVPISPTFRGDKTETAERDSLPTGLPTRPTTETQEEKATEMSALNPRLEQHD